MGKLHSNCAAPPLPRALRQRDLRLPQLVHSLGRRALEKLQQALALQRRGLVVATRKSLHRLEGWNHAAFKLWVNWIQQPGASA
jgi:hypothetical protein